MMSGLTLEKTGPFDGEGAVLHVCKQAFKTFTPKQMIQKISTFSQKITKKRKSRWDSNKRLPSSAALLLARVLCPLLFLKGRPPVVRQRPIILVPPTLHQNLRELGCFLLEQLVLTSPSILPEKRRCNA